MTDQPEPVDEDEDAGDFHVMPDAALFLRLERRVTELEKRPAPTSDDAELLAELRKIDERLGRHRVELETLKAWQNDLLRFLRLNPSAALPALQPAAPPLPEPSTTNGSLL